MSDEIAPLPDMQPFSSVQEMGVSLWGLASGLGTSRIMDKSTQEWMASYGKKTFGLKTLFAINGEESDGRVLRAVGEHFPMHNRFEQYGVEVFSGAKVDGLYALEQGQAFWMRSADCLTVVAVYPSGKMAALHAGRHSLLPDGWRAGKLSVIQNLHRRIPIDDARIYLFCGVGPMSYPVPDDHPKYGPNNAALRRDVVNWWGPDCIQETQAGPSLSLIDVARGQLIRFCKVAENHIAGDGIDTVADRDGGGNFMWASAVRGDAERNHVLVANVGR